jgi:hypothetical protein
VQQDILETFVDREELRQRTQPTLLPNGRRIPGLKLDQPRQLARMHSLVRFCYLAAEGTFTTRDLYPQTLQALRRAPEEYKLGSLRYDLWKLRAKGLVEKIPHSRRYRLLSHGYQICLVFLKLYEKICAPLTASILQPFAAPRSSIYRRHSGTRRSRRGRRLESRLEAKLREQSSRSGPNYGSNQDCLPRCSSSEDDTGSFTEYLRKLCVF